MSRADDLIDGAEQDARVDDAASLAGRQHLDRIEVHLRDLRDVLHHRGNAQKKLLQCVNIGGRRAAPAGKQQDSL